MTPLLAVDWGTTNLRAWRIGAAGNVEADLDLPAGVAEIPRGTSHAVFESDIRTKLDPHRSLPVLMCGMVGSNLGWQATDYVPCPAKFGDLRASLVNVGDGAHSIRIVPGLRTHGLAGPDIMRGEETQIFGWMTLDRSRNAGSHIICHPGTHSKWARIEDGAVTTFATAMTGELFNLLQSHSILSGGSIRDDEQAFLAGVKAAGNGDALSVRLFSARSRVVAGGADPETAPSYLSGLLIGAEIAALPQLIGASRGDIVHLIAAPALQIAYAKALDAIGWRYSQCDGEVASRAGLVALASGDFYDAG